MPTFETNWRTLMPPAASARAQGKCGDFVSSIDEGREDRLFGPCSGDLLFAGRHW
jgi:hypothetical protein